MEKYLSFTELLMAEFKRLGSFAPGELRKVELTKVTERSGSVLDNFQHYGGRSAGKRKFNSYTRRNSSIKGTLR